MKTSCIDMKLFKFVMIALILSGCSSKPENFAECILEKIPGANSEIVRSAAYQQCRSTFGEMFYDIRKGNKAGVFSSYSDGQECLIDKSKGLVHKNSVINIKTACSCLYDEPQFKDQKCAYTEIDPSKFQKK